jgi:hypothetical protein
MAGQRTRSRSASMALSSWVLLEAPTPLGTLSRAAFRWRASSALMRLHFRASA